MKTSDAEKIIGFWFVEHGPKDWYAASPEFDRKILDRFDAIHAAVSAGEGFIWRDSPKGRLAEIIVLDQFSRQLYRGDARAFAQDGIALVLAQELVAQGLDRDLNENERQFAYMPYMHAESLAVHDQAMTLFAPLGEKMLGFEKGHRDLIERFGRFPLRNAALGRQSTPEEIGYMAEREGKMY
jgi:uncharacterized protein (DUF924 family)